MEDAEQERDGELTAPLNRLDYWMMYLSGMAAEEMPEEVAKDEMISQALDLEKQFLQNQEERQRYITSYKAMVDDLMTDETIRRVARDEGLIEGEAKGKVEGIAATARRMLNRGVSPEQVADFTGLSRGEVEALRAGTGN